MAPFFVNSKVSMTYWAFVTIKYV